MLASVLAMVAEWLLQSFGHLGMQWLKDHEIKKLARESAEKDAQILKSAHTIEEKALAARKIADDSF